MQSSPPPVLPDETFLGRTRDTDHNWSWNDKYEEHWEVVTDEWQKFYEHWRDSSTSLKLLDKFPYVLELGVDQNGRTLLPFHGGDTSGNRILVTESYNNIFHRLLDLRQRDKGKNRGAVLTGQPGTGKTTFLKFMLAKLISAGQVVLLHHTSTVYLFYHGQVYSQPAALCFQYLPKHLRMAYCPIWALIDGDRPEGEGLTKSFTPYTWPVQATSPNPTRWKSWSKQNRATLLGMPLWNMGELVEGFCLHPGYNHFRRRLEQFLPLSGASTVPTTGEEAIDTALEVLQTARERGKDEEAEKNEDHSNMGDDPRASVTDQDKASRPQAPIDNVDNALKVLVHNATEEFGFIPSDVYGGVLNAYDMRIRHANALKGLQYTDLQNIVRSFCVDNGLVSTTSHLMVVVFPRPPTAPGDFDTWAIDFKSIRIARRVMELMQLRGIERLPEMYEFFHKFPMSAILAGWFFEAIVHRMFSDGWESEPTPQPVRMVSDGYDPPVFSTNPSTSTSLSPFGPPRASTRAVTRVNFADRQLSDVTLDNDKYYVPTTVTHPLFDSFTIDVDPHTVVISVLRITISQIHEGSTEGYTHIRTIMRRVRKLLKEAESDAAVKVGYFLVCPDDGSRHQWRMPVGWNEGTETHDHRGDGFCIRVPVPGGCGPH